MKEKYGQYMTPADIADFMCSLITHGKNSRILEPSCGKGIFLETLDKYGFKDSVGYEIDSELIKDPKVKNTSFVSENFTEKFDVIIGNPPYIRWKNLEEELKTELAGNTLFQSHLNSLNDYSAFFILKSVELLEDGGELIFITPDYWMYTTHSQGLRDYMAANGYFTDLYMLKEAPVFKGVTVSLQIFRYIKGRDHKQDRIHVHMYNQNRKADFDHALRDLKDRKPNVLVKDFEIDAFKPSSEWMIMSSDEAAEISALEQGCRKNSREYYTLGEFCDIGNGMVSGLDKAFQIADFDSLNDFEKSHTIRVIKAKSLNTYYYRDCTPYIFLEGAGIRDEADLKTRCPHLYACLQPYREQLLKRYQYGRTIDYWMWVFLRNYTLFSENEKKIFVPCKERISNKDTHRFCLTDGPIFPTQDVSAVLPFPDTKESIEYITAHLNSGKVFTWIKNKGLVKGNIVEFSRAPLARIPFRRIDFTNPQEKAIHDQITKSVREYIKTEDTSLLKQIDDLMAKLY